MAQRKEMRARPHGCSLCTPFAGAILTIFGVALVRILVKFWRRTENGTARAAQPSESPALGTRIDKAELGERYKANLSAHYLSLHVAVIGVVLAAAAAAAASLIARNVGSGQDRITLWLLWIGSLAATGVAYGGPMVGAFTIPDAVPMISDLLLPILIGIAEFLLFAILVGPVAPIGIGSLVNIWLIAVSAFSLIALLAVQRARYHYVVGIRENVYSEDVAVVTRRYLRNLTRDSCSAGALMIASAAGAELRISNAVKVPSLIFPAIIAAILLIGLVGHSKTAKMWRDLLRPD